MSGHSKWATIKRHKAAVDAKRGKIFSVISKELTLAARDGGGDPEFNPRLRTLIQKAKSSNMPADNVDRAIKKGTGELPGVVYEENLYEGYAAGGVGLIVEVTTDNKNRSASEVRSTMSKNGGNLAGVGAVSFQFDRKGQFIIEAEKIDEEALMEIAIEAGSDKVLLIDGGNRCQINGEDAAQDELDEYPALYARMAELVAQNAIDVDLAPMVHVSDAMTLGRRQITEPFDW